MSTFSIGSDKSFKSLHPFSEVVRLFAGLKESGDSDGLEEISFEDAGKGRITLVEQHELGDIAHEVLALFISKIIAPGDYAVIKIFYDGGIDHAWLILNDQIFYLNCDHDPRYKGTPYRTFIQALMGKENLDVRYRSGVVEVKLGEIVGQPEESFNKLLSQRLTDDTDLNVKRYELIGHEGDTLVLKVEGYLKAA